MLALRLVGILEMVKSDENDASASMSNKYSDWSSFNESRPEYAYKMLNAEKDFLDSRGNRFYQLHTEKPTNLDNTIYFGESLLYVAQGVLMLLVARPVYTALKNRIHDEDVFSQAWIRADKYLRIFALTIVAVLGLRLAKCFLVYREVDHWLNT